MLYYYWWIFLGQMSRHLSHSMTQALKLTAVQGVSEKIITFANQKLEALGIQKLLICRVSKFRHPIETGQENFQKCMAAEIG